jgi:hypothetical protein
MEDPDRECLPLQPPWTWDGDIGNSHWWDGDKWNGGKGSWSLFGEKASFADEPGFNGVELALISRLSRSQR